MRGYRLYARAPIWAQNLAVSAVGIRLLRERFDWGFARRLAWLRATERWPPERIEAHQVARIREILRLAHETIPFYGERLRARGIVPADVRKLEDLAKLPILRRQEVREHGDELLSSRVRRRSLVAGHTSGTTGSPLQFWWDRNVCIWNHAMLWRHRAWAGAKPWHWTASLLGNPIVPLDQASPPYWRTCVPLRRIFFSSHHLSPGALPSIVDHLRKLGRVWLEAYPSTAYVLARYLEEREETLALRGIFLSSEPLLADHRALIEDRLGARAWDAYSMAERVVFSGECERHRGQHLFPEFGIVEVVDDDGNPVPRGATGRIVATGLRNRAMPLLRYDTGDVGALARDPCDCGRTLPTMAPVTTKAEDLLVTPEGRLVSASILTHAFKPAKHVERSQIVQDAADAIRVRIVPGGGYTDADGRELVARLAERLGSAIEIELEIVDDIPRTPNAKYRWVISSVPIPLGGRRGGHLDSSPGTGEASGPRVRSAS